MTLKKKHVSRSIERHVHTDRARSWQVLVEQIGADGAHSQLFAGPVLSDEPPWRICYELAGDDRGLELCQATFVIRDDGTESHISCGLVGDPEPSPAGDAFLDTAIGLIDRLLDRVVAAAER